MYIDDMHASVIIYLPDKHGREIASLLAGPVRFISNATDLLNHIQQKNASIVCVDPYRLLTLPEDVVRSMVLVFLPSETKRPEMKHKVFLADVISRYRPAAVLADDWQEEDLNLALQIAEAQLERSRFERHRRESMFAVSQRISNAVAKEDDEIQALLAATDIVGEALESVYAEIWVPDAAGEKLIHSGLLGSFTQEQYVPFFEHTRHMSFEKGQGLPGKAWQENEIFWKYDVRRDADTHSPELMTKYNFGAALVIPIRLGELLRAVVVLFFSEPQIQDPFRIELASRAAWEFQQSVFNKSELVRYSRQSQRMRELISFRDQFLNNMNHELRTPMNGVMGFASLLADQLRDRKDDLFEYAESIVQSSHRLMSSFEQMMYFLQESPYEAEDFLSGAKGVELAPLLESLWKKFQLPARRRGIDVRNDIRVQSELVVGSEKLVSFLLSNVLEFCLSQASAEGWLSVECFLEKMHQQEMVCLDVKFSSIPLDQNMLRIFNSWGMISGSDFYNATGAIGPALPLAQRITMALGGDFHIEIDEKATVALRVHLPLAQTVPNLSVMTESEVDYCADLSGTINKDLPTVLLVEDDRINQRIVRYFLQGVAQVHVAVNASQGRTLAEENEYIILLMDIHLGSGANGLVLLDDIRAGGGQNSKTPAVAITGYTLENDMHWLERRGFAEVLRKPLNRDVLIQTIVRNCGLQLEQIAMDDQSETSV